MFLTSGTKTIYDKHIVAPNRDWSAKLYYYYNGTWYSLGTTNLQSLQISDYSTDGSNITMGTVVGGKLTVNLIKVASSVVGRLTKGTAIKIKLTLNSSAATSGITLTSRVFVIDDSKLTLRAGGSYNVSLTAYDFSYKMTDKFVASANNLTAKQILTEIGNKYGFTIGLSVDDAIAEFESLYPTTFTPLADYTCKQTIGYMAGCYGCFAYFDEELQLQFAWYESNGDIVDSSRIFNGNSYVSEMEEREIVMLETGTSDNPIVVPNNAKGFSINFENPYITQTQAEAIYNKRIADGKLIFKIGKLSYRGSPLNSPGAIISVKDINRGEYPFYIMKRTLRYDGGLSETIECQGESETTINYKLTSPTQQKINRALSRMEEAIKNATDIITQTKGSVFEFIPIDENDPTKGNSGWKLYSTEIGSNNLILANSSGIGFSSNGGQSFNAMALYIDENGTGHINANCIDVGKLSASVIDTSTLVVGTENVEGLDDELDSLIDSINTATDTANAAQGTANTANSNASDALSIANTANATATSTNLILGGLTAQENGVTVVKGSTILTGSIGAAQIGAGAITAEKLDAGAITAEKVNVGWQSGNCATGWTSDKEAYITITSDGDYNYNPKITMSSSYTDGNIDVNGIPFYASAGDVLRFGGRAYKKSSGDNGVYLKYSSKSDGYYNVVSYENTANKSTGSITDIDLSYTVTQAGWYMITVAFNTQTSGAYVTNIYCYKDVKGEMIVNGIIRSVDKNTYFDLDNSILATKDARIDGGYLKIGGNDYYTKIEDGSITQHLNTGYMALGGLVPTAIDGKSYQTLYYNNAYGVDIAKQDSDGAFTAIASFSAEQIRLFEGLYTGYGMYLEGNTGLYGVYDQSNRLIGRIADNGNLLLGYNYSNNTTQIYSGSSGNVDFYIGTTKKVSVGANYTPFQNIQYGQIKGVSTAGAKVSLSGFTNEPTIICTPLSIHAGEGHMFEVAVSEISKDSFTVKAKDTIGSYGVDVMWIAIGV